MPLAAAKIRRSKRQNEKSFGVYYISWAENIPFFPEESHNGRLEYVLLENKHT